MIKYLLQLFIFSSLLTLHMPALAEKRYAGGDISLLPKYEEAGVQYKTHDGEPIDSMLDFCKTEGMNIMRVRLFVDPDKYTGADKDPNACQSLDYIIPLCKRIKDSGFALILDFMYSDTWADPAKQWTPAAWAGMTDEELCEAIHDYTSQALITLREEGIVPDFIQPGNEISYGMLWGTPDTPEKDLKKCLMGSDSNWKRFGQLLTHAINACREECPDASIIIHTERVAAIDVQRNFYSEMEMLNIDYDIIGLSYYPYWHGDLANLDNAITELTTDFPEKDIMIVETGYPYKWEVPGTTEKVDYPYSDEGQADYATDLVDTLEKHPAVTGLLWWWMEYNAYGTKLEGWYNAPLFDSTTGKAGTAFKIIGSFAHKGSESGIDFPEAPNHSGNAAWYDINGVRTDPDSGGLMISTDGRKIYRR